MGVQAVAISHYNVISDLIQFATFAGQGQNYAPPEERRFRPGDVASGGMLFLLCIALHRLIFCYSFAFQP